MPELETPSEGTVNVPLLNVFLLDFAATLLAVGSQPSRVLRSAKRIGATFGCDVDMLIMHKHLMMTIFSYNDTDQRRTSVRAIQPAPFSFDIILQLNILSWNAHDHHLSLEELWHRYTAIVNAPRYKDWLVRLLVACANAAFCRLFGGDAYAMLMVGLSTYVTFYLRQRLMHAKIDPRMIFMASAFVASGLVALALPHVPTATPAIALGTSVLFLIPGVPLINAINDIMEGFVLLGIARAVNAAILVICVALGLAATLLVTGGNVL